LKKNFSYLSNFNKKTKIAYWFSYAEKMDNILLSVKYPGRGTGCCI